MEFKVDNWLKVISYFKARFDKDADVKSILFVIGLREYGRKKAKFTKEEKQDIMNWAFCKVMSLDGYFEVSHLDKEGWPIWKQAKPIEKLPPKEQEELIKQQIIRYFEDEGLI